jgi:hypothetical protein
VEDFGVRGARRMLGLLTAALAAVALLGALAYSVGNLLFLASTQSVIGEVVAVAEVRRDDGVPVEGRWRVVVEFPDRNGQFRRFEEEVRPIEAPRNGDEVAVLYQPQPPIEARINNPWWLWRDAAIWGGIALGLGVVAEELLRNRRRSDLSHSK